MSTLHIQSFAHIADASIRFGDLTILVGPQGTGKSLILQWLKTALDGKQIVSALKDAGQDVSRPDALIDLIFGIGMGAAFGSKTRISFGKKLIHPSGIGRLGSGEEKVFFIPAHRAMLISDGWASPFQKLTAETPVVARLFSQNLFDLFTGSDGHRSVSLNRVLKHQYCILIDDAIFHGGIVRVEQDQQHARRLKLTHGKIQLSFMTWTAGQREFTPLLLGLHDLLPARKTKRHPTVEWVVIEEPEMGLHPQAVCAFMVLVLELLWRGYRVVLSTHSPLVLTAAWALRRLSAAGARWQLVCKAFGLEAQKDMRSVATAALEKDIRVHSLSFDQAEAGHVYSKDISSLDPGAEDDEISGWGGITGFGSRFSEAVRQAVNEQEGA